ncbi:MAG: HAMP domain-containing protein [Proteobacteria bacterium]|nr:HAMP domain-containing protein [Pseudomonadota bacterium]
MPQQTGLYGSFNRFLERHLPSGLYKRALIILIAPVVLLQTLMVGIILERYYDNVTRVLGRSMARQASFLIDQYEAAGRAPAAFAELQRSAKRRLRVDVQMFEGQGLPAQAPLPFYAIFEQRLLQSVDDETGRNFWIDSNAEGGKVEIRVELEPQRIISFKFSADRVRWSDTQLIVSVLLGSSLLFLSIAMVFLRNQIRPIVDLARAATDFGMGRATGSFRPRGATEVKRAGQAFVDMRDRIERHVEQRTTMLAGVSHDLRTILTRFKLELAVLGDNPKIHPLKEDVDEMQHMLEDYMAFVKGDGGEEAMPVSIPELVSATVDTVERERPDSDAVISIGDLPTEQVSVKPNAFRRLLANLLSNAVRYGHEIQISGLIEGRKLVLRVDDNGPGIPADQREDVFRPFVRLDNARNLDETGTGLGLAIARDIAQAHGGEITLEDSALGGLRAVVSVPI